VKEEKMKSVSRQVGLIIGLILLSSNISAEVLVDTAAGSLDGGALGIHDNFVQFHRFEVTSATTLASVGGVFKSSLTVDVFAAVISLTGSNDFPDSFDLSTPDVIGTTLISITPTGNSGGEFEGLFNLALTPGWYAIGFGTNAFGASSIGTTSGLSMPSHDVDLAPSQLPFTLRRSPAAYTGQYNPATRFFATASTVASLSCIGFESPLDGGAVRVKKNRALPHKGQLLDENNQLINDLNIAAPPVIQVIFHNGSTPSEDVTGDALSAGAGTDGNQFEFLDGKWQFNLKTSNYSATGTYTITMESGDTDEYLVNPPCTGSFVIN
jgi:hypothetical protein